MIEFPPQVEPESQCLTRFDLVSIFFEKSGVARRNKQGVRSETVQYLLSPIFSAGHVVSSRFMFREGSVNFLVNLLVLLPARVASVFSWAGPLVMRLVVGYVFMLTGWAKLNNLPQMIQNFTEWGIPFPTILTPFASSVECFGGALLILGLFTRIPAAMLIVVMIVAIKVAKWGDVDSLETLLGFEEVTYLAAFLWLAIAGPGAVSLDRLLLNATGHTKEFSARG